MKENFETAYRLIRQKEGGLANRPKKADPGGLTNFGVTQKTYDAYRTRMGLPLQSVRNITQEEVRSIYYHDYAKPVRFDELPAGIDYVMFDMAIHSGVSRAVKLLQRTLKVQQDGDFGSKTMNALQAVAKHSVTSLIEAVLETRLAFLKTLRNWKANANGWQKRITFVQKNALSLARTGSAADRTLDPVDYAPEAADAKGYGQQSLTASIASSKRSQAAVAGGTGAVIAAAGEAVTAVEPLREALSWTRYAEIIGLVLIIAAFIYIIWHRAHKEDS